MRADVTVYDDNITMYSLNYDPAERVKQLEAELAQVTTVLEQNVTAFNVEHNRSDVLERQLSEAKAELAKLKQKYQDIRVLLGDREDEIKELEAELAKCRLNDKWNDEDKRLEVEIIGKCLVISVGIGIIAFAFETHEDNSPYNDDTNDFKKLWIVSDKLQFAKDVISAMLEESETGASPITDFIDTMSRAALEDGSIAIDEAGPIPEPEGE